MRWNRHVKAIGVMCGKVESRSCADGGGNASLQLIVIGVFLLDNADHSLATDYVNTLAVRVIVQVICVASTGQCCNNVAGLRVKDDEPGWAPGSDKQPMICFVERHRKVESIPIELPFGNRASNPLDRQRHASTIGIVHEDFGPRRLQLKRFWVSSTKVVVAAKALVSRRIDDSDRSAFIFPISHINLLSDRIVADVIWILAKVQSFQ